MLAQTYEKTDGSNYKILIVDGNNAHLQLLEAWLRESGFMVVAIRDGYEAIARFNNEYFDLILTDVNIPSLNGNLLAKYIHINRQDAPVVAITVSPFLAGPDFDLVISKPYELEGLVTSLQYVLGKFPSNVTDLNNTKRKLLYQLQDFEYGYQTN